MSYYLFTLKYKSVDEHEDCFLALGYTQAESVDEAEENLGNAAAHEHRSVRKFESYDRYATLHEPRMLEVDRRNFEVAEGAPYRSVIVPLEISTPGEPSFGFPNDQFAPA
jgi:hypothetical protein